MSCAMYVNKKQINAYVSVHERQHQGIAGICSVGSVMSDTPISSLPAISLAESRGHATHEPQLHLSDWSTRCKRIIVIKGGTACC